jgi:hypothetical protein
MEKQWKYWLIVLLVIMYYTGKIDFRVIVNSDMRDNVWSALICVCVI